MNLHKFIVSMDEQDRIDKFLVSSLNVVSRSRIQELIKTGYVRVDGEIIEKSNQVLSEGQTVEIELIEVETDPLIPGDLDIEVIYADEHTIVLNKPAGIVVHPGAGLEKDSIASYALYHWPEIAKVGQEGRPGIVHRLDKDTSGVMLLARTQTAYDWYIKQFKGHHLDKVYLALVDGHPPTPEGRIEAPIIRDTKHRKRMTIGSKEMGREAISEYFQMERFQNHELLRIKLETGRTHQIRVHMAFLGTPVVADRVYGKKKPSLVMKRFFLHASEISICMPGTQEPVTFTAKLPDELEEILTKLRM